MMTICKHDLIVFDDDLQMTGWHAQGGTSWRWWKGEQAFLKCEGMAIPGCSTANDVCVGRRVELFVRLAGSSSTHTEGV